MGGVRGGGRAPQHYARALRCHTTGPFASYGPAETPKSLCFPVSAELKM